ncbi:MAG: hypothetical protein ABSE05_06545 [Syntrophales bacterium]|jgi:hypothetical protein
MKKIVILISVLIAVFLIGIVVANEGAAAPAANPIKEESCSRCHPKFKSVLQDSHPPIPGNDYKACKECHSSEENKKRLIDKVHERHNKSKCSSCHTGEEAKP